MNNEQKFIITVRFPEWELESIADEKKKLKHPAYGIKYLFITHLVIAPDWAEDDERWLSYSELDEVAERFIEWYKASITPDFNGEILFIEEANLVIADGRSKS